MILFVRTIPILMFGLWCKTAWSQPPRAVEVWGDVGIARAAGDEGYIGDAATYGGGVSVPLTRRLAIQADVRRMRAERFEPVTRVLVTPALVWRWGNERVYGYAGGGVGLHIDRSGGIRNASFTSYDRSLNAHAGIVFNPAGRLIVRSEVFSAWRFVLPTTGVTIGIGYRF